jgi:hypothetical protein
MKIIGNTYKHTEKGFSVKVTTCNRRLATTANIETGEQIKFNRSKFEWMVSKGVFSLTAQQEEQ